MSKPISYQDQMGKEYKITIPKVPEGDLPHGVVKLCSYHDIQHLEGKLKTWADSSFTDKIQREAVKDVLQDIARELWDWLDFSADGEIYKRSKYLLRLKLKGIIK